MRQPPNDADAANLRVEAAIQRHAGWQLEYDFAILVRDRKRLLARIAELEELGIERHAEMLVDEVRLRSIEIRNGGFKMELDEARDLAAIYVACARSMLGDAENYSETPIQFHVKVAEQPELYILTVQRTEPHKLTPHQARQQAEAERDEACELARVFRAAYHDEQPGDDLNLLLPGWLTVETTQPRAAVEPDVASNTT